MHVLLSFLSHMVLLLAVDSIFILHSSTDNLLSPVPFSDWLTFSRGTLILYQKRNENDKNAFLLTKNETKRNKKSQKKVCKQGYGENIGDEKFSVQHTLLL